MTVRERIKMCNESGNCSGCPNYNPVCARMRGREISPASMELLKGNANAILEPERWDEDE